MSSVSSILLIRRSLNFLKSSLYLSRSFIVDPFIFGMFDGFCFVVRGRGGLHPPPDVWGRGWAGLGAGVWVISTWRLGFCGTTSAKINFSYSILFHLTTSYSSYFGGKKGISRNKTSFFLLMHLYLVV